MSDIPVGYNGETPVVTAPLPAVGSVRVQNNHAVLTGPVSLVSTKPEPTPAQNSGRFQPGNQLGHGVKGVAGRPRSVVRQAATLALAERIPILCRIADGDPIAFKRLVKKKTTKGPRKEALQDEASVRPAAKGMQGADGVEFLDNYAENDTYTLVEGYESAKIEERIKALEALMKISGVALPINPEDEIAEEMVDEDGNPIKKVRYIITAFN